MYYCHIKELVTVDLHVFFVSDHIATYIPNHTHTFFQLMYCKGGSGCITAGGKSFRAEAEKVYLAKPDSIHAIENFDSLELLELKFYAYGDSSEKIKKLPDVFSIADNEDARNFLFRAVSEGLRKQHEYNGAADSCLSLFFISVLRSFMPPLAPDSQKREYAMLDATKSARDDIDIMILNLDTFIKNHIMQEITLDMLADEVHFNKTYFVKRFKDIWGVTPMKYVNNIRLARAREKLLFSSQSISEIALKTGFRSAHYFSRKFKEYYGTSPQNYRTQHL